MKKLSILTLLSLFFLLSCKNKDYKEYRGTWKGTYTGGDTGTWNVEIDEEGNIDGTARSDSFPGFPFDLTGTLSKDGDFDAEADVYFSTATFSGKLKDDKASGTWKNVQDSISGTWSGSKD